MKSRVVVAGIVVGAACLLSLGGWGQPGGGQPNKDELKDKLKERTDKAKENVTIFVGTVLEVWQSTRGEETRYKGLFRVHKPIQGKPIKTGEVVEANWWIKRPLPGEDDRGHDAAFLRPGRTVKITMHTANGNLRFPDGAELTPEPIFLTAEVLKGRDVGALKSAADRAMKIGAYDEAATAWARAVELDDGIHHIDNRLQWAACLTAAERHVEASQAAKPGGMHKTVDADGKPVEAALAGRIARAKAAALRGLWSVGDYDGYLKLYAEYAAFENTAAGWKALRAAAVQLKNTAAQKQADDAIKALGGDAAEGKKGAP